MPEQRERWHSRPAFVLAAIGSAVGLGNLWRFPYIAYQNGGGAFLIPYFVAILTAGVPLIILEFALGHIMQGSAPAAMRRINRKLEWIGWWALIIGSIISFYYAGVMSWCWNYLWHSFTLKWGADPEATGAFFKGTVLGVTSGPGELGGLQWPLVIGMALTWIAIFLIICRGVRRVGKVVLLTVPLPVILIIVLIVRGVTLDGAMQGLTFYLNPDWSKLKDPSVWLAAYGQIFFSLSLGFGIMIAYSSYLPRTADITNNGFITVFANCGTSFLAGFAVFSTLGYLAMALEAPIDKFATEGPGLAFVIYPAAISQMPWWPAAFGVLFFITLLSLGIDSAFSIVEGAIGGIRDKWHVSRMKATAVFCSAGLIIGLLFCTRGGLHWIDIIDHWMLNFGLVAIGLAECMVVRNFTRPRELSDYINSVSEIRTGLWWDVLIREVTPAILFFLLVTNVIAEAQTRYGKYPTWALWVGGWGLVIATIVGGIVLGSLRGKEDV